MKLDLSNIDPLHLDTFRLNTEISQLEKEGLIDEISFGTGPNPNEENDSPW